MFLPVCADVEEALVTVVCVPILDVPVEEVSGILEDVTEELTTVDVCTCTDVNGAAEVCVNVVAELISDDCVLLKAVELAVIDDVVEK